MKYSCSPADLEHVLRQAEPAFQSLQDGRLFVTGGTGFWGIWLLESLSFARTRLGLNLETTLLTRSPEAFREKNPRLAAEPWLKLQSGDVRSFTFPDGSFSHVIHAATEASDQLNREQPQVMLETISAGTRQVLDFVCQSKASQYLLASSGATYGALAPGLKRIPDAYDLSQSTPLSAYAEGKRWAEQRSLEVSRSQNFRCVIARGFAFVGPHLPLHTHFAIGNFIRDALQGGPLRISSDGTGRRSYLYAADMAAWLWHLLAFGKNGAAYNVGSPEDYSIAEIAEIVARCAGLPGSVEIANPKSAQSPPSVYVPDIRQARDDLGLDVWISLEQAVQRTLWWHRNLQSPDP